jgi:tetratricopeptide (TPR) repeat protein
MDKKSSLKEAKQLRKQDQLEESNEVLLSLLQEYPDDPQVLFEVGGSYDLLGSANEAIPFYRRAIDEGLTGPDLQECYICFGICQRAVGDFEEALETLEEANDRFEGDNSIKAFHALAMYSTENYSESVRLLLEILIETSSDPDIQTYSDTLAFYKDNLDEVWES